jgi:hypothetical protein
MYEKSDINHSSFHVDAIKKQSIYEFAKIFYNENIRKLIDIRLIRPHPSPGPFPLPKIGRGKGSSDPDPAGSKGERAIRTASERSQNMSVPKKLK